MAFRDEQNGPPPASGTPRRAFLQIGCPKPGKAQELAKWWAGRLVPLYLVCPTLPCDLTRHVGHRRKEKTDRSVPLESPACRDEAPHQSQIRPPRSPGSLATAAGRDPRKGGRPLRRARLFRHRHAVSGRRAAGRQRNALSLLSPQGRPVPGRRGPGHTETARAG